MRAPSSITPDPYARVHGSPGEQPRLRGLLRVLFPLFVVMGAAGYLARAALPWPPLGLPLVGFLLVILALLLALALSAGQAGLASFLKGARGEERVGRILGMLSADHHVFHGLPAARGRAGARGDLDHVVVGPTGVFVIETKRWAGAVTIADGRILVGGQEPSRPPVEQVQRAAEALRARLREACGDTVTVQPILCFADATGGGIATRGVSGVLVCDDQRLLGAIREHDEAPLPPTLRASIVAALVHTAG